MIIDAEKEFKARMEKLCKDEKLTKGKYILTHDNEVIPVRDLNVWGEWMDSPYAQMKRVLCRTYLRPDIFVSTVFLAMDHSIALDEESHVPILWETMVFKDGDDMYIERYTTREQAIAGHLQTIDMVRAGFLDELQ